MNVLIEVQIKSTILFNHNVYCNTIVRSLTLLYDHSHVYFNIYRYTNADFAGDVDDIKSTSGSIFFLNGGPVAWASKKQPCTSLSTTEAEYISACQGPKTSKEQRKHDSSTAIYLKI